MFSPRTARHLLLLALVYGAVQTLPGCAHFDRYEIRQPMADYGSVKVTWLVGYVPPQFGCGYALEIEPGHYVLTFREKYDFNHPCWAHEFAHAFGARHQ
jgi:hypothetical protein